MGGNIGEFTTELNPTNTIEIVILRGGHYFSVIDGSAGYRWDDGSSYAYDVYGFRSTLFFK